MSTPEIPRFSLVDTKPMTQSFLSLVRLLHEAKPDSPYYNVLIGSADSDLPLAESLQQVR